MAAAFEQHFTVPAEAIDANGHVNNVEYLRWMISAAHGHAEACGGSVMVKEIGAAWVVRTHHIEYLKALVEGDHVVVCTWVESFERVTSLRRYEVRLAAKDSLVAKGETKWALIDVRSGSLRKIPKELTACFGVVTTTRGADPASIASSSAEP